MDEYKLIALRDILKEIGTDKDGKHKINKLLSVFSCKQNNEVENFLHNKAMDFERIGLARTTLVYAGQNLIAYFSLTTKDIDLENMNQKEKKTITNTSYPIGNAINSILIGQLGKDDNYRNLISGEDLMHLIFSKISVIDRLIPSVLVYVDFEDKEFLKAFYNKFGFKEFKNEKKTKYLSYAMTTKEIIEQISIED